MLRAFRIITNCIRIYGMLKELSEATWSVLTFEQKQAIHGEDPRWIARKLVKEIEGGRKCLAR